MSIKKAWLKIKARKLVREGKVRIDLENEVRIHFTVFSKEIHYVIFDKIKNEFSCDCKWFSLKGKECSHILAAKMYLESLKSA
ncbi:MAG: SWIM zinc finger family protein [Candidatus Aenigmatarchaeota archaeon]